MIVFSLGLFLGLIVENERVQLIQENDQQQKIDFNSLQLQYQFIDLFGEEKNCDALEKTFEESIKNLESTRKKIEKYLEDASSNKDEFAVLKREYTLAQIQFWLLNKKTEDICQIEQATILYFYADNSQCSQCANQEFVLTYLKNEMGVHLLNFAFDAQFEDEPLIDILKNAYQVTQYPTLIIEGKKFEGLTSKEVILQEICSNYHEYNNELCAEYQIIRIS
ncbi:hypothetical protein GOV03_02925 [Candidatus Woesearchaeota archaeon]|nr:hypothetical protein [Candidatus Woesearchaeota archaeon]